MKEKGKRIVSLLLAVLLMATVVGCGEKVEPNEQVSTTESTASQNAANTTASEKPMPTEVSLQTLLNYNGETAREQAFTKIVDDFKAKTGVEVKVTTLPWEEVDTQLMLKVQSGNAPDISYVRDRSFGKHMQADSLLPLNDYIKRDFSQSDIDDYIMYNEIGIYNDQKFIFPVSFIAMGCFIRADLLSAANLEVPKTWDDFVKAATAMQGGNVLGYMFGASPAQANQLDWFQPMIEGRGGKVLDENGNAVFDSEAGIEAFEFLRQCVYESKIAPSNVTTIKYDDVTDALSSGRVAMAIEGSHRYAKVKEGVGAENLIVVDMPGVTADKTSPCEFNCWTLGIPNGSKSPDVAWEFIKHFTSTENQLMYSKMCGEIPTRKSTTNDEYFKTDEGKQVGWWSARVAEAGTLAVAPTTSYELNEIFAVALQEVLSGPDSDIPAILKDACEKYNAIPK